ncbi:MAG: Crp/Fnr family transcriptional regulator [Actinomycetota bacterium]
MTDRSEPVDPTDPSRNFLELLSDDIRTALFDAGHRRRFAKGTTLFFQGDHAHEALVILDGLVKATIPAATGREIILNVLGPGALIGEVTALDGGRRSATIVSLTEVEVLVVEIGAFNQFLLDHPTVLHDLARVLAARLRIGDRHQLEFGTGDSLQRLCARLVELADHYGEPGAESIVEVLSPLNQSDLASWSGLSREAVVKSLRVLRDLGWIENRGRRLALLELDKLRERAGV